MIVKIQETRMPHHTPHHTPHHSPRAHEHPTNAAKPPQQSTHRNTRPINTHSTTHPTTHPKTHLDARLLNVIEVANQPYLVITLANSDKSAHFAAAPGAPHPCSQDAWRPLIGLIGYIAPSSPRPSSNHAGSNPTGSNAPVEPAPSCEPTFTFTPYPDQSLRRASDLDVYAPSPNHPRSPAASPAPTIGWRCHAQPDGFLAPVGLVPGLSTQGRAFVCDDSEWVSLAVPSEFLKLCAQINDASQCHASMGHSSMGHSSPLDSNQSQQPHIAHALRVLSRFMADACALRDPATMPRADGLASSGDQAQELASNYLHAAWPA